MPDQTTQTDQTPAASPGKPPASPPAGPLTISDPKELKALADKEPEALRAVHGQSFSGIVLRIAYLNTVESSLFADTAQAFQIDTLKQMEARDPLEQMLIDQMLWTHVRIGRLSIQAVQQSHLKSVQIVHEAADRALNAFRRQMLALQEYRCPKPAPSFTAIKQQNIALMNGPKPQESKIKKVTNEKETSDATQPKTLPADTGTTYLPAGLHSTRQAVAVGNRAEDGGREGT